MATTLDSSEAIPPRGVGRPGKYPWADWFKHGVTTRINKGVDYDIPTENMRIQVNKAAGRFNGRTSTKMVGNGEALIFTFYLMDDFNFDIG